MIPSKLTEVLIHNGIVSIVMQGSKGAHVVNTRNSYMQITEDERLLGPVGVMHTTLSNVKQINIS